MNDKVYIHELINIRGQNRAKYMHHMTANWVPVAIAERNQLCFGVWGTVGSTGNWPEVVNMWELDGWDGLAANFAHEFSHASAPGPVARCVVGPGGQVPAGRLRPDPRARAVDAPDHGPDRAGRAR